MFRADVVPLFLCLYKLLVAKRSVHSTSDVVKQKLTLNVYHDMNPWPW